VRSEPGQDRGEAGGPAWRRRGSIWAAAAFLCLAALALGANPFSGQTVAPLDLLVSNAGWSSLHRNVRVLNYGPHDILDNQLPVWMTLKRQIRNGQGALVYPSTAGGDPLSFEPYNPPFLLFLSVDNDALALYLVALFKLFVAAMGTYLFLRSYLGWLPSVWGSFVFMLCGFTAGSSGNRWLRPCGSPGFTGRPPGIWTPTTGSGCR
jgi:hypothetical protein